MADRENPEIEPEKPVFPRNWADLPGNIPPRSDAGIKRDLEDELFRNPDVRSYEIKIEVQNGIVTLSGTVDDDLAKMAAQDTAQVIPGVKEVRNNIEVKSPTTR